VQFKHFDKYVSYTNVSMITN